MSARFISCQDAFRREYAAVGKDARKRVHHWFCTAVFGVKNDGGVPVCRVISVR